AAARRLSPGLTVLGLAFAASLSWAPAATAADMTSWQAGCQFKAMPGSGGEGLRYDMCLRLQTCQRMVDAGDQSIARIGCFGFAPEVPAAAGRPH
ncbi:MAG: hypothetical protein LCH80_20845, partial [Proteobacteria bacterium]|nr:hypothetical protein [Pseudomonadota bacterium]